MRTGSRPEPLALLRLQAAAAADPDEMGRIRSRLRGDTRAGARALARSLGKRIAAAHREASRLEALFAFRRSLLERGLRHVAGIDEVGVGPLAGPFVAAAVILPASVDLPGLDDSKKLRRSVREALDAEVRSQAIAVGIGEVCPAEIDRVNILRATLEAMRRAVAALGDLPDHLLVDARTIPGVGVSQTAIIGGDALDGSIAAASIVAKVHRDSLMRRFAEAHPGYGFDRHMGYGTVAHLSALRRLGPSPIHRRSFQPVADVCGP